MFKNIIFPFLLFVLGNTVNTPASAASSTHDYAALAAQQKLEIWHDVQPAAFYGALPDAIAIAIEAYQAILKTDRKALPSRIGALQAIARLATDSSPSITLLHQTAANKAIYLQGILEQQPFLKALRLEKTPGSSKLRSGLGVQNGYMEGEFIPRLDPAFRDSLAEAFSAWEKALETNPTLPEFYLWLETRPDLEFKTEPAVQRSGLVGPALIKARRVYFNETGKAYNALYGDKAKASKVFDGAVCWPVKPLTDHEGKIELVGYHYNRPVA